MTDRQDVELPALGCSTSVALMGAGNLVLAGGVLYAAGYNPGIALVGAGALALYAALTHRRPAMNTRTYLLELDVEHAAPLDLDAATELDDIVENVVQHSTAREAIDVGIDGALDRLGNDVEATAVGLRVVGHVAADPEVIGPRALAFESCPICSSSTIVQLPDDWNDQVEAGHAVRIVGCGNPWHYRGAGLDAWHIGGQAPVGGIEQYQAEGR